MDNKKIEEWYLNLKIPGEPDEFEVKALLALFDIEVPKGQRFEPEDDISVSDFHAPFVLKACSSDLLHKTDIGGVVLNVDEKSLIETANKLRAKFPVKSLLIEELVKPESIEFIVGALVDPNFGPAVMVGTGGIFTELYKDVAFRLIPCSQSEIFRMLDELTVSQVFKGFRGSE